MNRLFRVCAAVLFVSMTFSEGFGQDSSGVREVGRLGHISVRTLHLQSDLLYIGESRMGLSGVGVYDYSELQELGDEEVHYWGGGNGVYGMQADGNTVYVAGYTGGLYVIDFSNGRNGQTLAHIEYENARSVYDIVLRDQLLYIQTFSIGLRVYDVNDPQRPEEIGVSPQEASGVALVMVGDNAFIAANEAGLKVVSVEDPRNPEIIARLYNGRRMYAIAAEGDILCLGEWQPDQQNQPRLSNLLILNVSDPENPQELSQINDLPGLLYSITISGEFVYLAAGPQLKIINIADPENPQEVGWHTRREGDQVYDVVVDENIAFVATNYAVLALDCSNALGTPDLFIPENDLNHDFGEVAVGRAEAWPLVLSNIGHYLLQLESLELSDPDAYSLRNGVSQWRQDGLLNVGMETDDRYINGVEYVDGRFYVTGGDNGELENWVYIFDEEGELIERFPQFARTAWGMRDLAWDGELLWGADGRQIYGFTREGELQEQFAGPLEVTRSLAWDPDRQLLWVSDLASQIFGLTRNGDVAQIIEQPNVRMYGLAWDEEALNGYNLLISASDGEFPNALYSINPGTSDLRPLWRTLVPGVENGRAGGGLTVTSEWNPPMRHVIGTIDAQSDAVAVWQLTDYYIGEELAIEAEHSLRFDIEFHPDRVAAFPGELTIRCNDGVQPEIAIPLFGRGVVNRAPEITDLPEAVEITSGERFYLLVLGSDPDNDSIDLQIIYNDLPRTVSVMTFANGRYGFVWQTADRDTGDYSPSFVLTDGLDADTAVVLMHVISPNSAGSDKESLPEKFVFHQPYPNPFNNSTVISYDLPMQSAVVLSIVDLLGKERIILSEETQLPGTHSIRWDAGDLSAGVYILRLRAGNEVTSQKVALVK